ncbi:hypothetical protein DSCW_50240 [Desulfosarcina widdelii]|uniref:DUF3108 domain-containing protein n=1 Tax=Desulfosarcina widdelii TaxID=947919 RepID=A0A5K7ZN69_9BACT|nr:DUF3108 domain-containing protein [Desulfosarcina widdelii]BBO77607.1 hypothetical protein DSCW_50240 [Desulfosarcina widdelii]
MNGSARKPPVRRQHGEAGSKRALNRLIPGKRIFFLFVAAFLLAAGSAHAEDDRPTNLTAFQPGERLTFALKWTIVPAGTAVLEVLPGEHMAGLDAFHFVLTARSNAFVDAFYTVRDRVDAWADAAMQRSLLYRKKQREGSTRRDITVSFDWDAMTAQYVNGNDVREPIAITEGSFDPLSIFYWSRFAPLAVGGRLQRPVTDGKKHVLGIAHVVRRESIRVPAGRFDTFLLEPDLRHVGGVFEKSPDAKLQLWVTADRRRLPVKLKSKVVVGSFTGELTGMIGTVTPAEPELSTRP